MAKRRPTKPRKKREQPWMAAAREKLHAKAAAREDAEVTDAFLELAQPGIESLPISAGEAEVRFVLERARFAWNLPILHALSTEQGSEGAEIRADAEPWLAHLADHASALRPLFTLRTGELASYGRPIAAVFAQKTNGELAMGVIVGEEPESVGVLDIGDTGWPKASRSLLALFEPVRDRLHQAYTQEEGEQAIALAVVAWNLHVVDRASVPIPEALRQETLEGARRAREQPEAMRAAFEEMVEARRTRFAYDPRAIAATHVTVANNRVYVQAATIGGGPAPPGSRSVAVPAKEGERDPRLLSLVRGAMRGVVRGG
jgi:hypothetical protein